MLGGRWEEGKLKGGITSSISPYLWESKRLKRLRRLLFLTHWTELCLVTSYKQGEVISFCSLWSEAGELGWKREWHE